MNIYECDSCGVDVPCVIIVPDGDEPTNCAFERKADTEWRELKHANNPKES